MGTLETSLGELGPFETAESEHLSLLISDWQIVADLSFADLALWRWSGDGFVCIAQCRPSTGPTVHLEDLVGTEADATRIEHLHNAVEQGTLVTARVPRWDESGAVREEALPVVLDGDAIAVITRETTQAVSRSSSRLELNYRGAADDILMMVTRGEYPMVTSITGPKRGAPRVGDGVLRLDSTGHVTFASPNAMSCFHRLGVHGSLVNRSLPRVAGEVVAGGDFDETLAMVVMGRAPWRTDIEANGTALSLRAIPVTNHGQRTGAVLLCRDVGDLRRRERELITKDATIREIHHRVKNNLQTVAALLRMQSRRVEAPEAREALSEAMRRVSTIAMVHETLSGTLDELVNFDDLVTRTLRMAADVASAGVQAKILHTGGFGLISAQHASALALVMTELVTNAVQHGLVDRSYGTVTVESHRDGDRLSVTIIDDGKGLSAQPTGLGSQIVTTLVENELHGSITWEAVTPPDHGTRVHLDVKVG